ncbi:hypothetical protein VTN00DRAFT_5594 [Thermoascus crustaceus]|uniref:uncharacterized protein n=1 Tax=Thermoascus crustaceus TaxID=5088 RepID=UPI0037421D85
MVNPREMLDIIELIFYVPALIISIFVSARHGFGRQLGWIFLCILSIIRLVGAVTGIASIRNPSEGLFEATFITNSAGLSPLLLAMLGMLKRVHDGMPIGKGFSPRLFNSIHLPTMAALVLAIIGGTKSFNPDIDTQNTGRMLIKVAVVLFLVVLIVLAMIALVTFSKIGHVVHGERKLVFAAVLSLPFLFVRILYSIIAAFSSPNSKVFSLVSDTKTVVAVQALMATAEEFVVATIYLLTGLLTPVIARSQVRRQGPEGYQVPSNQGRVVYHAEDSHSMMRMNRRD